MANPEHLAILKQGVEAWNRWREENPTARPDLADAFFGGSGWTVIVGNLAGYNLNRADLRHSQLESMDMREASLIESNLQGANLVGCDVSSGVLIGSNLSKANLAGSRMIGADLSRAYLLGTNLRGAELDHAILGWTTFGGIDFSVIKGLESVIHEAPSTIGIDSIYRSGGEIPERFLRGAGVPDDFIAYVGSITAHPIRFYSCFISYSTKDQGFADRLYADLQSNGVRCWFAPHDVKGGRKLHEQIDEAIRIYDRLLLILSDHSMNSEWVKTEIANAHQREVLEKRQMLFPISLVPFEMVKDWKAFDADSGKDAAREVREYFIPDFSNWKTHGAYQVVFERLLRDLKAEGRKPPVE